jgi:hypothetical protein
MYWSITLPEKLLLPLSRWRNKQVFYYEHRHTFLETPGCFFLPLSPLTGEGIDLLTDEQVQNIDRFYEKKKCVLFGTDLRTTTRMTQKKMQRN